MIMLFLVIALGLTHRYINRPSALNARLTENSYIVFLIHYPLLLLIRLMSLTWDVDTWMKFAIALVLTIAGSYALSRYLIKPAGRRRADRCSHRPSIWGKAADRDSHLLLDRRATWTP